MLLLSLAAICGLAMLYFGGDALTVGAAEIARRLRISPLVIGLTVVSIATSLPELFTSLFAAKESPDIALSNIVGSNWANIGLIMGIAALIRPIQIQGRLIRREIPVMVALTVVFWVLALGGLERWEGILLLGLMVLYLCYTARSLKAVPDPAVEAEILSEIPPKTLKPFSAAGLILGGALLLSLGAELLIGSSVEIAGRLGVNEVIIGLTLVALGTSLPELAAAISAAARGHSDLCAGNLIGSNIFNLLLVGGGMAAFVPVAVSASFFHFELPALLVLSLVTWRFLKTGSLVTRLEGGILIFLYVLLLAGSVFMQHGA